jgi:hypothetical protein
MPIWPQHVQNFCDLGAFKSDVALVRVARRPAPGQYCFDDTYGIYEFHAADSGAQVFFTDYPKPGVTNWVQRRRLERGKNQIDSRFAV